jgi:hypothetical protein
VQAGLGTAGPGEGDESTARQAHRTTAAVSSAKGSLRALTASPSPIPVQKQLKAP